MASVCVEYLDDVAVAGTILQLKHVGSGGQNLAGNFHGLAERDTGLLIPVIRANTRQYCGT